MTSSIMMTLQFNEAHNLSRFHSDGRSLVVTNPVVFEKSLLQTDTQTHTHTDTQTHIFPLPPFPPPPRAPQAILNFQSCVLMTKYKKLMIKVGQCQNQKNIRFSFQTLFGSINFKLEIWKLYVKII